MTCPKCGSNNTSLVNDTHYICNNPTCRSDGKYTQFKYVEDEVVHFPYNQIFLGRSTGEFYRKPYLELKPVGLKETIY